MRKTKFILGERSWIETSAMIRDGFIKTYPEVGDFYRVEDGYPVVVSEESVPTLGIVFPLKDIGSLSSQGYLLYNASTNKFRFISESRASKLEEASVGFSSCGKKGHVEVVEVEGRKALAYTVCYIRNK